MGADEKHAATYHGVSHNPDTDLVRTVYAGASPVPSYEDRETSFDRWLETVRAEAKAEALDEVADEWERLMKIGKQMFAETTSEDNAAFDNWAGQEKPGWLRARANQYKENQS